MTTTCEKHAVIIHTRSEFIEQRYEANQIRYLFAYHIKIINTHSKAAQLISRHWVINDGSGNQYEIKGIGVVGQQPMIPAGGSFEYSSCVEIPSPIGSMHGTYLILSEDSTVFTVTIPIVRLSCTSMLH